MIDHHITGGRHGGSGLADHSDDFPHRGGESGPDVRPAAASVQGAATGDTGAVVRGSPSGPGFVIAILGGLGGVFMAALAYHFGAGVILSLLVHVTVTPLLAILVGVCLVYRPQRRLARIRDVPRAPRPHFRTPAPFRGTSRRLR
ncbi:hypothetical protein DL237_04175 [Pseudooceanicola sediminis]|uniref:Uncharacterized protein n=1 Tax=Pseudooceanicola sediminis TaxID=2211117 RepID=A0A399J3A4_9RHOB|nr:hypothetical protein [Pseudooceanicola sediminis]KAA2314240.1 hypothetical protein E0K93_11380 [Puniceibacterium sp. HSS470]RII39903.1 hypothetical protein DL237_04175 [Pseudooceanicola sediminis]